MKLTHTLPCLIASGLFLASPAGFAACSKEDVDHYLKSGFTHDQVVKLCTDPATAQASGNLYQAIRNKPQQTPSTATTTTPPAAPPAAGSSADQTYFATVIEGNPVQLAGNRLIFERKECAVYGDLDMTEQRDKACLRTRTTVDLKGLEIKRAVKGILLIRDQELLVKGNIRREYLDTSGLNVYKMAAVREQLPVSPGQLNIPVKKGIDPKAVAERMRKYQ